MLKRLLSGVLICGLMAPAFGQGLGPLSVEDRVGPRAAQKGGGGVSDEAMMMLMQQLQQYEHEINMLRGQFDELRHELDTMKSAERERYLDIDARLNALSGGGAAPASRPSNQPASGTTAGASADPEVERAAYMAAREHLYGSRFDEARQAFEQYLKDYPQGQFRDFSHFWLGEAFRSLEKPERDKAMAQFRIVIERFPDSSRVPSAMYRLAVLEAESGRVADARVTLNRVIQQFPNSSEAGYAKTMLGQIK
jgi:tol-pal system protein YbgF